MKLFQITVKADTNDADYITNTHNVDRLDDIYVHENEFFEGSKQLRYFDFCELLSKTLTDSKSQQEHRGHNWASEYSNDTPKRYTIMKFLEGLGYNPNEDSVDEDWEDQLFNEVENLICDFLPYGDYGVHTVVSIEAIPVGQVIKYL